MHPEALPGLTALKAPRKHGATLSLPPLDDVGRLSAANAQRIAAWSLDFDGISLSQLRELAHEEAVATAQRYLEEAGEPVPPFRDCFTTPLSPVLGGEGPGVRGGSRGMQAPSSQPLSPEYGGEGLLKQPVSDGPLFVAGHQPELFHPGVWIKNFALQALARRHGATPLNLVVDNDNVKATALRVPHVGRIVKIPFDRWQPETPYEERRVADESLWASVAERVRPLTRKWPFEPMLPEFWAEAVRQRERTPLLGERLARARRMLERAWGLTPLEAPLSSLCRTTAFAWFATHLLRHLPRFHAAYNAAVQGYRRRHGLRSDHHPAPDLAADDGWLEAPLWAWRAGWPRRQRLFARPDRGTIHLRLGPENGPALTGDPVALAARFAALESQGYKVRTRALTTTVFSRLLLGNLFIHGIGGGKYDEVTDELFRSFYGLEPPGYLVLSATLHLPLDKHPEADAELRRLKQVRRDLVWNPERHMRQDDAVSSLAAEKRHWIAADTATHAQRVERYHRLREINERLRSLVAPQQADVQRRIEAAKRLAALHEINSSREYAFCLFPEHMVRQFFGDAFPRGARGDEHGHLPA